MLAQERRRIIGWLETLAGKPLQQKINIIQEHYPSVIFSESGIMYSLLKIDGETIRPLNESDFPYKGVRHDYGQWRHKPDGDWDLLNYENSITTSGLYLASQAWRYSATQEPDALDQAAKAFNSLDLICKLGEGDWRPGWMGKPYSGRISDQTSPDQYLDACLGMYHYHPHAPEKVRGRIEEMFVMFADYWQSVDYKLGYFGNAWDVKSSKGAYNLILLMINALAYRFSGRQEIYLQAFDNLYKTGTWQSETQIDVWRREGHEEHPAWELNIHCKFAAVAAEIILDILPDRIEEDMARTVTTWWKIWKYGMREDLMAYYHYIINIEDDTWRPAPKTEMTPREEWRFGCSFQAYTSEVLWMEPMNRTLYTCMTAIDHAPEIAVDALALAKRILDVIDGPHLLWIHDPDGDQLSKYDQFMNNILSSEGPATVLTCFWRGRVQGLW